MADGEKIESAKQTFTQAMRKNQPGESFVVESIRDRFRPHELKEFFKSRHITDAMLSAETRWSQGSINNFLNGKETLFNWNTAERITRRLKKLQKEILESESKQEVILITLFVITNIKIPTT